MLGSTSSNVILDGHRRLVVRADGSTVTLAGRCGCLSRAHSRPHVLKHPSVPCPVWALLVGVQPHAAQSNARIVRCEQPMSSLLLVASASRNAEVSLSCTAAAGVLLTLAGRMKRWHELEDGLEGSPVSPQLHPVLVPTSCLKLETMQAVGTYARCIPSEHAYTCVHARDPRGTP
jgi:hypothetical protein